MVVMLVPSRHGTNGTSWILQEFHDPLQQTLMELLNRDCQTRYGHQHSAIAPGAWATHSIEGLSHVFDYSSKLSRFVRIGMPDRSGKKDLLKIYVRDLSTDL
ncbi:predicted protein [Botrytis cinerea T4]|uniref:Uncharacterized protein n=1 Tax=Botryotinia fuckeliana (strain T4) TaxID=999810 RepID=G2XTZ0_BOTF4|nr:predicted protein [Botrytis cinerea T4]